MNERIIRELVEQCTEVDSVGIDETFYYRYDLEKFAELIVRECVKVAVFKDSGTVATAAVAGYMAAGRSIAASLIKEHFGVEE